MNPLIETNLVKLIAETDLILNAIRHKVARFIRGKTKSVKI